MKEEDLFPPLKDYFMEQGYTIYSEVQSTKGMQRADMVLTKDDELIVIEMKKTLSFQLIDQARNWLKTANYVYVAVPVIKGERSQTAIDILNIFGIGLIEVNLEQYEERKDLNVFDEINRKDMKYGLIITHGNYREDKLLDKSKLSFLTEEHQTWSKGGATSSSKYVTTYALLMNDIYRLLREAKSEDGEGWVSVDEMIEYIQSNSRQEVINHYKNPKPSITQALNQFECNDIETIKIGKKRFYSIMDESTKYLNMEGQ